MGSGYLWLSTSINSDPDVLTMRDRTFISWVRSICWLNEYRDSGLLLPADVAHAIAPKKCRRELLEMAWWIDDTTHYFVPEWSPRGRQLWKRGSDGRRRQPIPDVLRQAVYDRDGHACLACGTTDDLTLDHIQHWSVGGPDSLSNLRTLCRSCNSSRRTRTDTEWLGADL